MPSSSCPRVVVVGAAASGTLTAIHLTRLAGRRGAALEIHLVDPADNTGRGVAFGTTDDRHLLNVVAGNMSALPEDPGHFVVWRARQHSEDTTSPLDFAPRREFGRYLEETLSDALAAVPDVRLQRHRSRATAIGRTRSGVLVRTSDGHLLDADAAVIATGLDAPSTAWAPEDLVASPFFVPDPWAPGALDVVRRDATGPAALLLVGTGLTMVDVTLSLAHLDGRPGRAVHAISRGGRLPHVHADVPGLAAVPDVESWGFTLEALRVQVAEHLRSVEHATGDWRQAVDGLRVHTATLWGRLDETDRAEFLRHDASRWNVVRHRMAPESMVELDALRDSQRLTIDPGRIEACEPLPRGGLRVTLSDGTSREVGWVINCTGPDSDVRNAGDPLVEDLLRTRAGGTLAVAATAGMGFRTVRGRLVDEHGRAEAPLWTLGALRRGELWESTAIPEIRAQARAVAQDLLDEVAPMPRTLADGRIVGGHHPIARPRDPLGLALSTTAEAAASYNLGLDRVMRLQSGGEDLIREAVALDPGFAVGHAALAMLGHEAGADCDVEASLAAAQEAARRRADERERSFVEVVTRRVADVRGSGAQALVSHLAQFPRDVLAASAAVPTIAFSGVTDVQQEAWELVEGLAPAYGDHWWYISLLAFTRQDQSRFDEAGMLAESALSCEPASGHAVHAQTHVLYETGQHEGGRVWLDHWVAESGRGASHRAHYAWHAALHELALGDTEAVRQRYYSQLGPGAVTGVRALVDSASLLWRWRVTTTDWDPGLAHGLPGSSPAFVGEAAPPPVAPLLPGIDQPLLSAPETPFVATHAALALAGDHDLVGLAALERHTRTASDPTMRTVVAPFCAALLAALEERWETSWRTLADLLQVLPRVGGSAAQREVVEETLLLALVHDGRAEQALELLDRRLDRRTSPLDRRRRHSIATPVPLTSA
ncbi:FAD/NAD(P)-binding protein [Nocardioides sp.]|uniref:FAD/NAD(P)-binding protein n=1 Tax=Nocardioides sp. TaxID=35761 RepID=UPI002ED13201